MIRLKAPIKMSVVKRRGRWQDGAPQAVQGVRQDEYNADSEILMGTRNKRNDTRPKKKAAEATLFSLQTPS
jgi:hypothetical protein